METVQLQCGNCQKLMAIGTEHLGGHVQCPHCQAVVQAPAQAKETAASPPLPPPATEVEKQRESIFSEEATEDVLAGPAVPRLEITERRPPIQLKAPPPAPDSTIAEETPASPEPAVSAPADPETDLTSFQRRPIHSKSLLPMIFMIFLVPYAIMTTLFIIYLLAYPPNRTPHPLDMMPDPVPNKNKGAPHGARQIIYNHPLAAHQKTTLGKSIRAGKDGDLIVIPERVVLNKDGNLQLLLRVRNISASTPFVPINDFYVRFSPSKKNDPAQTKPYTYLESSTGTGDAAIYGAYLEFRKKIKGKEEAVATGMLAPSEEEYISLETMPEYHDDVEKLLKTDGAYIWRVQLRRGLVKHNGKQLSTTAVIAVEFTKPEIQDEMKKT